MPPLYPLRPAMTPAIAIQRNTQFDSPSLASASPVTENSVAEDPAHVSSAPVSVAFVEAQVTPSTARKMGTFSSIFGGPQSLPRAEVSPTIAPAVVVGTSRNPSAERAESRTEHWQLPPMEDPALVAALSTRSAAPTSSEGVIPPHRVKGAEDCLKCKSSFGPFKRRNHVRFFSSLQCLFIFRSAGAAERSSVTSARPSDGSRPSR